MKISSAGRADKNGVALVIILCLVALLTGLVLAYFSYSLLQRQISSASANQSIVGIFAEGAVTNIVTDLKKEIRAGSVPVKDPDGVGVVGLYFPASPLTAVPANQGFVRSTDTGTGLENDGLNNLLKRSSAGDPFYAGTPYDTSAYPAPVRAAGPSTDTPSLNGRMISRARWNRAFLLPKQNAASSTDPSPVNAFKVPDWILVARNGTNPVSWNNNLRWSGSDATTVVGRYAYSIYDQGGLLDVNVAGFPPGSPAESVGEKGGLAFADLTVLPGMNEDTVRALVGWRNFASSKPSGNFPSFVFDATSFSNYFQFVRDTTSGFMRTSNPGLLSGKSDRMFVSRRQLIQFLTEGVASDDSRKAQLQNALQYLGTFSRDLEQPSFRPDPGRPKNTLSPNVGDTGAIGNGNDSYSPDGAAQAGINPALLALREAGGNPVFKRRFPLSRLALLKDPSANAAKIKDYFGLTWDATTNSWVYDHGDSARIYRLSEVPAGREPDFFEILKSVIHVDSLGKQFGGLDSQQTPHGQNGVGLSPNQRMYDGETQSQIAQIAANIIDQYDEDSYPTAVSFANRSFYGVENLPYMAGWQKMWYRLKRLSAGDINPANLPPGGVFPYESSVMIQPIIWNPHAPDTRTSPPDLPTEFRIYAGASDNNANGIGDTSLQCWPVVGRDWWTGTTTTQFRNTFPASSTYASANAMVLSGSYYSFPNATIDPNTSIITFNTGSGEAAFREPYRLRAPNYPPGSGAANGTGYAAGRMTVDDPALVTADGGSSTVIGFYCGRAWTGPCTSTDNTQKWLGVGQINRDLKLTLQYKRNGSWHTYDVIPNVYNASGNISTVDNSDSGNNRRYFRTCLRADPRTNRWGLFHLLVWPSSNSGDIPSSLTPLAMPGDNGVDNLGNNKAPHYFLPQGITWKPSANSSYQTNGTANGPAAPGWVNSSRWNLGDLMVNLARSPNGNPNSGTSATTAPGAKYYYTDPDGVFRRASGWNFSGNNGLPLYTGNDGSRPVLLNRPFRSVAELGYVFRDMAWKNLDIFSPESGDSALLDAFCLNELDNAPDDITVAGRINLNTRQPKVIEALLSGVSKAEGGTLSATEAQNVAAALVLWTGDTTSASSGILTKGPFRNRSELVGKFIANGTFSTPPTITGSQSPILNPETTYSGFASRLTSGGIFVNPADAAIPRRAESVMRALVDSGNTRTWNLLVDVVAQIGRYPATSNGFGSFMVEGETRIWVHLAIDRMTGKVIAKQWEPVSE